MKTRFLAPTALMLLAAWACGGSQPTAKTPDDEAADADKPSTAVAEAPGSTTAAPGASDDTTHKAGAGACTGFELDLMAALNLSACEVPNVKSDTKPKDVKDTITVTAMVDTARVASGGHANLVVTFKNKGAAPVSLDFIVDPLPRFSVETYSAKTNKRVDMPPTSEPKTPAGLERVPGDPKTARVTIAANGTATVQVPWDAVKTRWAPEKLKGSAPEAGYPRVPAGPLAKGKYNLRVMTPLTNVFEGVDHEVSAPRTTIEIQ